MGADSVSRNAAFAIAARLSTAAITAFIALFLGRKLGPQVYGYFALAMSIGTVSTFLADLGITSATPRFLAERRHHRAGVTAVLGDALRLKAFAAVPVSVALFALAGPITDAFDAPGAEWPLRGISIAVLAQGFFLFVLATFEALGRIAINLRVVALESVVEGSSIVVLVLLGAGATGAAFGRAIGYTVGVGVAAGYLWRVVGRPRPGAGDVSGLRVRQILAYSGALLIVDALFRAFAQIDVLLIGAILGGGRAVGLFDMPMQLAWFLHYPAGAISTAVAPRMARTPDAEPQIGTFIDAMRWITALQGIFLAPIIIWAEPIMTTLLGDEFRKSGDVLQALAPFVLLSGPALLASLAVNYLGAAAVARAGRDRRPGHQRRLGRDLPLEDGHRRGRHRDRPCLRYLGACPPPDPAPPAGPAPAPDRPRLPPRGPRRGRRLPAAGRAWDRSRPRRPGARLLARQPRVRGRFATHGGDRSCRYRPHA